MKKTLLTIGLVLAFVAGAMHYAPPSGLKPATWETPALDAQASFTSTTLSAAVTTPVTTPGGSTPPSNLVTLASGTGVTRTTLLYVDRELMQVLSIANSPTFQVARAVSGTLISAHASGATVKVGQPQYFGNAEKPVGGACTATSELISPYINISTGRQYQCVNSIWVGGTGYYACGTVAACSPTFSGGIGATAGIVRTVYGTVALGSASPSVATVTGIVPNFTSSTSFVCAVAPVGADATIAGAGVAVSNVDGTSITVTGQNTVTTVINYICVGT